MMSNTPATATSPSVEPVQAARDGSISTSRRVDDETDLARDTTASSRTADAVFASREPRTTGSQPWSTIGAASATVITANSSIVTTRDQRRPGPTSRAPRSEPPSNTTPASTTPDRREHRADRLGRQQRLAAQQHRQDHGRAAVRDDHRADHAQRPDPQRREVAQVRGRGADAQRQARQDPGGRIDAEPRAVGEHDDREHHQAHQLRPGQHAEAAQPAARDGARDVHHAPRQGREQAEGEAGGHRRSLRVGRAGTAGVACYTSRPVHPVCRVTPVGM